MKCQRVILVLKKDKLLWAGRMGQGQKPEQRRPKSRTKWDETQGGARSKTERLPSCRKVLPALRLTHLERLWEGRCFWP